MNPRLAHLEKLVDAGTKDPFVLYALALEYQKEGQSEQCLSLFDRVMSEHPDYLPSYLMAGTALAKYGQVPKAKEVLEKGIVKAQAAGDDHTQGEIQDALAELS